MGLHNAPLSAHVFMFFAFLFIKILIFVSASTGSLNISCLESERKALVTFKQSLVDESGLLSSWIGEDCCAWHGVQCNRRTRHVFKLDLHNPVDFNDDDWEAYEVSSLRGKISNSLHVLKNLAYLDLSMNDFLGAQIPEFLVSFKNLRYLNLSYSYLGGQIPLDLGRISSLQYLDLHNNDFNGSFPVEFGNLAQLRHLDLSFNKLEGSIPAQTFSNLTQMETLDLSVNNFSGSIPLEIFSNLTQIVKLQLSNNKFTGNLPATVKGITFLKELYIGNNQLSGILPVWLGELSELQSLDLSFNFIAGTISQDHMRNLTRLKHLQLSSNLDIVVNISFSWTPPFQLTSLSLSSCKVGPLFPQWLRNQIEIEDLLISNGSIEDTIPDWFEEVYSTVKFLDLSHNQIKGKWFEKTLESRVVNLDLSHNQLSGSVMSIPYELEQLDLSNNLLSGLMVANDSKLGNWSLISLILKNNQLIGKFPDTLCNMKTIEYIYLQNNLFSSGLPTCLGSLEYLQVLDLTNNAFSGHIPRSLGYLPHLQSLHLHNNKFRGKLPATFQHLTRLVTLDLAENEISGILPSWIGEGLSSLKFMTLQSNNFHGEIPLELCYLSKLQMLNLAQNNISGSIPSCFGNLTAMTVDHSGERFVAFYSNASFGYGERLLDYMKGPELEFLTSSLTFLVSIDLSNNNISGEIPKEVISLSGLLNFNVSGNHIRGKIPDNIGILRELMFLDLSRNQLSGHIPQSLSNLSFLTRLNLSFNDFTGRIPTGNQLQTLDDSSIYTGNPQLCGIPSLNRCSDSNGTPDPGQENKEEDDDNHLWFYGALGPGFFVGFLGFCGPLHFIKSRRYAYYRFLNKVGNRLALAIAMKAAWFRQKFHKL
nr:PREDICTED: leucine-rich repeat receptor-like protein FASCIATED EAR2 [Daucus carota subsp. sativus]